MRGWGSCEGGHIAREVKDTTKDNGRCRGAVHPCGFEISRRPSLALLKQLRRHASPHVGHEMGQSKTHIVAFLAHPLQNQHC